MPGEAEQFERAFRSKGGTNPVPNTPASTSKRLLDLGEPTNASVSGVHLMIPDINGSFKSGRTAGWGD